MERRKYPEVVVYSQEGCGPCEATKKMLGKVGLKFTEIDITKDESALNHIRDLGYTQTPVVEVGNEHWGGFRYEKIKQLGKIALSE